jgi:hypothetical protein
VGLHIIRVNEETQKPLYQGNRFKNGRPRTSLKFSIELIQKTLKTLNFRLFSAEFQARFPLETPKIASILTNASRENRR